jgi:hypothetical protein
MITRYGQKARPLNWFVLAAFAVLVTSPGTWAMGEGRATRTAGLGTISGFVYGKDISTPVEGAVVKIRGLSVMREMASLPTDEDGMYTISGVPEGRYFLGVSAGEEDFNLDYTLFIKAGELGKLSISLGAGETAAGWDQESGDTGGKTKGFFDSLAGRALVITAISVGLYLLVVEHEPSPIR